ncbi:hypothetical protein K2173_001538 [Erythroxylum novogranatense]|uniref:Uncharacterized protein n=1 Tax=Erythroxylum novogranatense TaxID=1862640 RepID=A0AAV8T3U6_9ROSI|nr:hypothetical protein K2173_001538 [Erythroxylum novogranatense]
MFHLKFHREYLDLILVPMGLFVMFAYHVFLLYRNLNNPRSTIIGRENQDKTDWVRSVGGDREKDLDRAVSVISSNTSAATYLATISLTLSSVIGTWLGSTSSSSVLQIQRVYGDTRPYTIFIKNICLLICFLLAFSGFVQAARHLVHANYLISSTENKKLVKEIQFAVTRALYFALNIILWFFGPIPMFVSSILMVVIVYYHDIYTVKLHTNYCQSNGYKGKTAFGEDSFSY